MSDKNIKINPTSSINNKSNTNKNNEKDTGGSGKFPFFAMNALVFILIISALMFYQDGILSALYFSAFVLLVIVLLYMIITGLYVYNRNKIKKQIVSASGVVNHKKAREMLSNNKYFYWFLTMNGGLFMLPCGCLIAVAASSLIFYIDSPADEVIYYPYYIVYDFFNGIEAETVSYVSESKYLYPKTNKYDSTYIYDYRLVNFQTSGGDLLTLTVKQDDPEYLEQIRSFSNTEIKYISRTGVYVP